MVSQQSCEQLVSRYIDHLQGNFATRPTDEGCLIVTPFIRPDGEFVELTAEILDSNGDVQLSDMGDTIGYLYVNGLTLSRTVMGEARDICRQFDVRLNGTELVAVSGRQQEIGDVFHQLLQSVLAVTDLIQRRRPQMRVHFDSEVESLIILSGTTYDSGYEVQGRDDKRTIKFHVNSDRNLLIQPLTAVSAGNALSWSERWAYRFHDILVVNDSWRCVAVLDDRGRRSAIWTASALAPLQDYSVMWSDRGRLERMVAPS